MGITERFARAGLFVLASSLTSGCYSDSDGAGNNSSDDAALSDADIAANGRIAERRERAWWYLGRLGAATTVEEERDAVVELAQWLELDECAVSIDFFVEGREWGEGWTELDERVTRIDFAEWEGRDLRISLPCYPPVTPWLMYAFLEPAHMTLLPLWDCSGFDSTPPATSCVTVPASSGI